MNLEIKNKKKWTLERVRKKLMKAGLSVAGERITDNSFNEILVLQTSFGNTVTIGLQPDDEGDVIAHSLAFNYGKPPAAEAGWYPMSKEKNEKEFNAMTKFAELIGNVPVYWRVVSGVRGT